ncbi:MAG: hypothetical protein S4CHLAM2_02810 [Chlamydiales bacterium]|nr:hypothetical protein [Chlamydiales bacterium]
MKKYFSASLLFFVSHLCAIDPNPGEIGLSAEWLYVQAGYDQPYFVIQGPTPNPAGPRIPNRQTWSSGYRLEGVYTFCSRPNSVLLRWNHLPDICNQKSISDPSLTAVFNFPEFNLEFDPGTITIKDSIDVYGLELVFDQKLACCGPFKMSVQGGVQYTAVNFKEELNYFDLTSNRQLINASSRIWGIGPEIGYAFSYCFTPSISLVGRGNLALLISERHAAFSDETDSTSPAASMGVSNDRYWSLTPASTIRFGFSFQRALSSFRFFGLNPCCEHLSVELELGYEAIYLHKGIDRIMFVDNFNDGSSFDNYMDLTLHGPYAQLGIRF